MTDSNEPTETTTDEIAPPPVRRTPRAHETVCLHGRTKWRLDALCLLGKRSRSATIEILIEEFLRGKPKLRSAVDEHANDPKPVTMRRGAFPTVGEEPGQF